MALAGSQGRKGFESLLSVERAQRSIGPGDEPGFFYLLLRLFRSSWAAIYVVAQAGSVSRLAGREDRKRNDQRPAQIIFRNKL